MDGWKEGRTGDRSIGVTWQNMGAWRDRRYVTLSRFELDRGGAARRCARGTVYCAYNICKYTLMRARTLRGWMHDLHRPRPRSFVRSVVLWDGSWTYICVPRASRIQTKPAYGGSRCPPSPPVSMEWRPFQLTHPLGTGTVRLPAAAGRTGTSDPSTPCLVPHIRPVLVLVSSSGEGECGVDPLRSLLACVLTYVAGFLWHPTVAGIVPEGAYQDRTERKSIAEPASVRERGKMATRPTTTRAARRVGGWAKAQRVAADPIPDLTSTVHMRMDHQFIIIISARYACRCIQRYTVRATRIGVASARGGGRRHRPPI
ncbi:hypothetical protein OF83DRAFT_474100 [Amylostereum chailletii]|nr:hypothetical protein OF83DRAFT_474100 [Amylostereum chailletii]